MENFPQSLPLLPSYYGELQSTVNEVLWSIFTGCKIITSDPAELPKYWRAGVVILFSLSLSPFLPYSLSLFVILPSYQSIDRYISLLFSLYLFPLQSVPSTWTLPRPSFSIERLSNLRMIPEPSCSHSYKSCRVRWSLCSYHCSPNAFHFSKWRCLCSLFNSLKLLSWSFQSVWG